MGDGGDADPVAGCSLALVPTAQGGGGRHRHRYLRGPGLLCLPVFPWIRQGIGGLADDERVQRHSRHRLPFCLRREAHTTEGFGAGFGLGCTVPYISWTSRRNASRLITASAREAETMVSADADHPADQWHEFLWPESDRRLGFAGNPEVPVSDRVVRGGPRHCRSAHPFPTCGHQVEGGRL